MRLKYMPMFIKLPTFLDQQYWQNKAKDRYMLEQLDGSGQMKVFRYSTFVHKCIGRATDGTLVYHLVHFVSFHPFSLTLRQVLLPSLVKTSCFSPGSICSCPTWETSCFCCSSCILTEWQTLWRNKMPQAVKHWIKQHCLSVLVPKSGGGKCHVKERMDEKWRWPLRLKWNRRSGGTGSAYVLPCSFYRQFSS